ncbi:MAG: retropepsin-like domain-containing protein [Planctomycetota bacterium]|nr:retropepsin-like domain-containing protein [Planctomycetota bacterium]
MLFGKTGIPVFSISSFSLTTIFISHAMAADWVYEAGGSQTVVLPGGFGAVANSNGTFYQDSFGNFSYDVILDSGASGNLMSQFVNSNFNVPTTGETYVDVGIGGSETFNVTQPIQTYFSPSLNNGNPVDGNVQANFVNYGTNKFQARQADPGPGGLLFYDIIGTPVIQSHVMSVTPTNIDDQIGQGFVVNLAETHLLNSVPNNLPSHGVYHVPLTFQNFVSPGAAPTEKSNPVIQNIVAVESGKTPVSDNWLFDSGASLSIVSPAFAKKLGIDTNAPPITSIQAAGVGGSTVTFDGYMLQELDIPLSNGDRMVINDPVVFVPEVNNLPASLTGVLGMNLFMQSTDLVDATTGEATKPIDPLFSQWYLDGPGNQLILVDPNSSYALPEPASLAMLILGGAPLLARRPRRKGPAKSDE